MIKEQEIPKYLKQKESNVSKARKKSKHKHQYEECILQYRYNYKFLNKEEQGKIHTTLSSYCSLCGKIGGKLKDSIVINYDRKINSNDKAFYSCMSSEELYERYHDKLPVFFVEDIWKDNYVVLEHDNK